MYLGFKNFDFLALSDPIFYRFIYEFLIRNGNNINKQQHKQYLNNKHLQVTLYLKAYHETRHKVPELEAALEINDF